MNWKLMCGVGAKTNTGYVVPQRTVCGISYNSCIAAAYWPHNLLFNQLIKLNNIKYESNEQNPRTEAGRSSEVYA